MTVLLKTLAVLSAAAAVFFGSATVGFLLQSGNIDGYMLRVTFLPFVVALAAAGPLFMLAWRRGRAPSRDELPAGLLSTAGERSEVAVIIDHRGRPSQEFARRPAKRHRNRHRQTEEEIPAMDAGPSAGSTSR